MKRPKPCRPHANVGSTLLAVAKDYGADLLVMGCYGHSRLREFVLGEEAREPTQDLFACVTHQVREIPTQRSLLLDLEVWLPNRSRLHDLVRPTVEARRNVQAMPVQGGPLFECVFYA